MWEYVTKRDKNIRRRGISFRILYKELFKNHLSLGRKNMILIKKVCNEMD